MHARLLGRLEYINNTFTYIPLNKAEKAKEAERLASVHEDNEVEEEEDDEPEPPKRARSAYLLFTLDRRPHIVAENPGMKGPKIMKQMGAEWRELDKDEKVKYENSAKKDKERYEAEKEAYEKERLIWSKSKSEK